MRTKFTPEKIESLNENEVFVFGSNVQGEHVGGAALAAVKNFGAKPLQGFGLQGSSYAIPTCVRLWKLNKYNEPIVKTTEPFANVEQIKPYVKSFINDAIVNSELTFYVTKIGCGIAGFKTNEVAALFSECLDMENVILPKEFVDYLTCIEGEYNNIIKQS